MPFRVTVKDLHNMAVSLAKSTLRKKMKNILENISSEEQKAQSVKVFKKVNMESVNTTVTILT